MLYRQILLAHAWLTTAPERAQENLQRRVDERGNNSLEMAIIISVVVAVALAVTAFIYSGVKKRLDGTGGI